MFGGQSGPKRRADTASLYSLGGVVGRCPRLRGPGVVGGDWGSFSRPVGLSETYPWPTAVFVDELDSSRLQHLFDRGERAWDTRVAPDLDIRDGIPV
jgi:hypothetical protein